MACLVKSPNFLRHAGALGVAPAWRAETLPAPWHGPGGTTRRESDSHRRGSNEPFVELSLYIDIHIR